MSLALDKHLDTLFDYGMGKIRENKDDIQKEWKQMGDYFLKAGKRSTDAIINSIQIFSDTLFNFNYDKKAIINNIKIAWTEQLGDNPINQFILTLIESSVHHAIKSRPEFNYKDYQAIQYVFIQINERILSQNQESPFTYDLFLQHLVYSRQLPIEWVAVIKNENNMYKVDKWFDKNKCLLHTHYQIQEKSMYALTEALLTYVPHSNTDNILTIPFEDKYLLLCTKVNSTVHITSFVNHALQLLQSGKSTLMMTRLEQKWKDTVIMFNESIIRTRTLNEALETITEGFINYLPFERCALFSYSKNEEVGFGLAGNNIDNKAIRNISEQIQNLPIIHSGLELLRMFDQTVKYIQPLYIKDARGEFPKIYVDTFQLKSLIVTPLISSTSNQLLGAAIIDQGPNTKFEISPDIYTALIKFGHSAGEVLEKFQSSIHDLNRTIHFSPREIEVLQLMADGESTTGAANILHLSEYTVRDYITSIMQKMEAKNRTEAVARAIRKGVI